MLKNEVSVVRTISVVIGVKFTVSQGNFTQYGLLTQCPAHVSF